VGFLKSLECDRRYVGLQQGSAGHPLTARAEPVAASRAAGEAGGDRESAIAAGRAPDRGVRVLLWLAVGELSAAPSVRRSAVTSNGSRDHSPIVVTFEH
jgi:hypothetical protein